MKLPALELRRLVRAAVDEVKVEDEQIVLQLDGRKGSQQFDWPCAPLKSNNGANVDPVILTSEASLRRAGKGLRLMIGDGTAQVIDAGLVKLIGRAVAIRNELLSGRTRASTPWRGGSAPSATI